MLKSGVYEIRNRLDGKQYFGSSVNITKRWTEHRRNLRNNCHVNRLLQRAWNKYGEAAFEFAIIALCAAAQMEQLEQAHLDENFSEGRPLGYNLSVSAEKPTISQDGRRRISNANRGRIRSTALRARISATMTGRHKSADHLANLSRALRGNKNCLGKSPTAATRQKLSAIAKAQGRKPPSRKGCKKCTIQN